MAPPAGAAHRATSDSAPDPVGAGSRNEEVGAVVVNYNAGAALVACVASLRSNGVADVVVVDNASVDDSLARLAEADPAVRVIPSARNLGYGSAANLGAAVLPTPMVLVCNPDLVVANGALDALVDALVAHGDAAAAGPLLVGSDGSVYPSGRRFPSLGESIGHGFLGSIWPSNPWTRRYRLLGADQLEPRSADWVSGACILVRASAFRSVGGFDEGYFMYAEDVDLCWRLRRAGFDVRYEPAARVVHEQGRSTSRVPYKMLLAHHRSLWRYAVRTERGPRRLLLPLVGVGLVLRLGVALAERALAGRRRPR